MLWRIALPHPLTERIDLLARHPQSLLQHLHPRLPPGRFLLVLGRLHLERCQLLLRHLGPPLPARTRLPGCIELLATRLQRQTLSTQLLAKLLRLRQVRLPQFIRLHHQMLAVAIGLHLHLMQLGCVLCLERLYRIPMPLAIGRQSPLQLPHLLTRQRPLALRLGQPLLGSSQKTEKIVR